MQGGIAQTIGLVLAANAKMQGIQAASWPEGSIYSFCNKVEFQGRRAPGLLGFGRSIRVENPNRWLETIPNETSKAQLNVYRSSDPNISDRNSVGFANGGPVFVAQLIGSTSESWYGEWAVTDEHEASRRIWSVTYRNIPDLPFELSTQSVDLVIAELRTAIADASGFAQRHSLGFTNLFDAALEAADSDDPLADYYLADMFPDGLMDLKHQQLFACAAKAWVFGGMGSWNDAWFGGDVGEIYEKVSDRLFASIVAGLIVATNASADGG